MSPNKLSGSVEVEFGGKKRLILFTFNSIFRFGEINNIPFNKLTSFGTNDFMGHHLRDIIFVGLEEGCEEKGDEIDFTRRDVGKWMGESSPEILGTIFDAYRSAMQLVITNFSPAKPKKKSEAGKN